MQGAQTGAGVAERSGPLTLTTAYGFVSILQFTHEEKTRGPNQVYTASSSSSSSISLLKYCQTQHCKVM